MTNTNNSFIKRHCNCYILKVIQYLKKEVYESCLHKKSFNLNQQLDLSIFDPNMD